MAIKQVIIYLENEDTSAISFQTFMDSSTDLYPTFTICFEDNLRGDMYSSDSGDMGFPLDIDNSNDVINGASTYTLTMEGTKVAYTKPKKRHNKHPVAKDMTWDYFLEEINQPNIAHLDPYYRSIAKHIFGDEFKTYDSENLTGNPPPNSFENKMYSPTAIQGQMQRTGKGNMQSGKRKRELTSCGNDDIEGKYSGVPSNQDRLILFKKKASTYAIKPTHYQLIQMGFKPVYEFIEDNTNCIPHDVRYTLDDVSSIDFDRVTIDLKDFLWDYHINTINGSVIGWTSRTYESAETSCILGQALVDSSCAVQGSFKSELKRRIPTEYPFDKVYQDPKRLCYSPKNNPNKHRKSDHLTIELASLLEYRDIDVKDMAQFMKFHVHMPTHFMRHIGKEIATFSTYELFSYCKEKMGDYQAEDCHGTRIIFDILQVTLLKSRHNSANSCNANMRDEDSQTIESILNDTGIGCFPAFWEGIRNPPTKVPKCKTDLQHRRISQLTSNFSSYEDVRKLFVPPCEEMIIVTNMQQSKGRGRRLYPLDKPTYYHNWTEAIYLDVSFRYVNDRYTVITNTKAYSVESCWSGIGGFLGIFVGISFMQLPELVYDLFKFLFKIRHDLKRRKKILPLNALN